MDCFVGARANSTSLWLVSEKYRAHWRNQGGRVLRKADPIVDGTTEKWMPLKTAQEFAKLAMAVAREAHERASLDEHQRQEQITAARRKGKKAT